MATLCLLNEDGEAVQEWQIGERPVTVGRGSSVDVKVDDVGLSRRHFMVSREGEDYILKDLSSLNGTWVDGARLLALKLSENDRILAGNTQFRFSEDRNAAAAQRTTGPHGTVVIAEGVART